MGKDASCNSMQVEVLWPKLSDPVVLKAMGSEL